MVKVRILFSLFLFISLLVKGSDHSDLIDSLMREKELCRHDTCRLLVLGELASELRLSSLDKAEPYALEALKIAESLKNVKYIATVNNTLGNIYKDQGKFNDAMRCYLTALRISEERKDLKAISASYINISNIHYYTSGAAKAREYVQKALEIKQQLKDEKGIAGCLNNIANLFMQEKQFDSALVYFDESLKIRTKLGNKQGISATLTNIAGVYVSSNRPEQGVPYFEKAIFIKREIGDSLGLVSCLINAGHAYKMTGNYEKSLAFFNEALAIGNSIGARDDLKYSYQGLAELYSVMGKYKEAYESLKKFTIINDSIYNEDIAKAQAEMSTKYETEKKEQEIALLNKDRLLKEAEIGQQRTYKNLILSVGAMVSVLALVLFYSVRQKQKTNKVLSLQKAEIEEKNTTLIFQKEEIELQKNEITDSINYARRIQESILPATTDVLSSFSDGFVLYNPKDIVSGDFYWTKVKNNIHLVASADCTGHGVPGALMSMIGAEKLHEAAGRSNSPGEILSAVNRNIRFALKQDQLQRGTADGMDIALIAYDRENRQIRFSGANRPLWIFRNTGDFEEVKGTKSAIGGFTESDKTFEEHSIQLNEGDQVYLFSDGFQDQFGGAEGKKLMKKNFKQLLENFRSEKMHIQEKNLKEFFDNWMAGHEQVDDVLVIGLKA